MTSPTRIVLFAVLLALPLLSCSRPEKADAEAQAWYRQGRELRAAGEPEQAMQAFLLAARSGTSDEALLGRVWSNMATMCRQANEHNLAYHIYAISSEHFAAAGDTLAYAYAINNMAWEQAVMGHKDSALLLVDSALRCFPHSPLTEKVVESRAAACLFAQEYDSVLYFTVPPANDYLLMLRAQAYSFLQIDDSATYYAQQLLPRATSLTYLDDLYYILTHNDTKADKEAIRILASERVDVQKAIEERHVKLSSAVRLLEQETASEEHTWLILLALVAALIAIGLSLWTLYLFRRHRLWHSEQSEQERLRRNERLHTIQVLCEAPDLRTELAWDDYAELCRRIDKLFHGLASALQTQGLNEQDIRISVLVLLGLSHKKVASMLNCSPKSIGKLKDITARKLSVSGGNLREKLLGTKTSVR
jgi:DNA-binding CsgD family transcriptional regulator